MRLSNRIRLIRNVLPFLIALVVVAVEFGISRLPSRQAELTAHLLFYGLLGPAVTFFSAEWIAEGTRARERAELELRELYGELSTSNGQLRAVQELMRDLADADKRLNGLARTAQQTAERKARSDKAGRATADDEGIYSLHVPESAMQRVFFNGFQKMP